MPTKSLKPARKTAGTKAQRAGRARGGAFTPPLSVSHAPLLEGGSDDGFRQMIYLIVEVLGHMMTCREAFGRAMGLTASQFAVLFGVAYRQGQDGVIIKRLAQYVHLASTHVTTEVGRLHDKGLLSKRASSEDRRSVLVSLTPAGEAAVGEVMPFVRRVNDLLFAGISARDLAAAGDMFGRMSLNSEMAIAEVKRAEREGQRSR